MSDQDNTEHHQPDASPLPELTDPVKPKPVVDHNTSSLSSTHILDQHQQDPSLDHGDAPHPTDTDKEVVDDDVMKLVSPPASPNGHSKQRKRQFPADDVMMSRLEFQQWTAELLAEAEDLEGQEEGPYNFGQQSTTHLHSSTSPSSKRLKKSSKKDSSSNVDPELENLDIVHDAIIDARTLESLDSFNYLRGGTVEDEVQHLAVQAVNQALSQAQAVQKRNQEISAAAAAAAMGHKQQGREFDFRPDDSDDKSKDLKNHSTGLELTVPTESAVFLQKKKTLESSSDKLQIERTKFRSFPSLAGESDETNAFILEAAEKAHSMTDDSETGKSFSTREMGAIDSFVQDYCKIMDITKEEMCKRIWANERKKDKFWECLQRVLPNRTRASLYKHVRRSYHIFEVRGKWTEDDDKKLSELASEKEGQWKAIGLEMNRMPEDCRDRWRNYVKCGTERKKNKWEPEEEENLKSVITEIIAEQEARGIEPLINWTRVSEKMGGSRSRIQCRYKWNKILRRESTVRVKSMDSETKIWLLNRLRELYKVDSSAIIHWDGIASVYPGGVWSGVDFQNCFEKLKSSIDNRNLPPLEVVDLLLKTNSPNVYSNKTAGDIKFHESINAIGNSEISKDPSVENNTESSIIGH